MTISNHTMTCGDVARFMELSIRRVHQLDGELRPIRLATGHRRYDPSVVEKVAKRRSKER